MSELETSQLGDVATIVMGQSPLSSTYNSEGEGLPFFQGKTDFGAVSPRTRVYCSRPGKIAEAGDILLSVRAPVGPTNINAVRSCIGRGLSAVRVNEPNSQSYLRYFLRFYEPKLAEIGKGSTFEAVNRNDLEEIPISLPEPDEQRRIAAILERADHLRRTRRFARLMSDTFLQSVFLQMFGDHIKWGRERIQDLIDKGFIVEMQDGNHGEVHPRQSDFSREGIPFLTATNVVDDRVHLSRVPRITQAKANQLRIGWVQPNDVLLSHNATVGRVAVVPEFQGKMVIGTSLTYYRLNPAHFNSAFFAQMLKTSEFQNQLEQSMKQTTRNQVPITRQRELLIPLPPVEEQREFAAIVGKYERLRAQQIEAERQAEHLFQTLLHHAFAVESEARKSHSTRKFCAGIGFEPVA